MRREVQERSPKSDREAFTPDTERWDAPRPRPATPTHQGPSALTREQRVDVRLRGLLPNGSDTCAFLADALRDACLSRGKRVRPVLAMLSAAHFGGDEGAALDYGCALELVHTASLVLDDLPCMDDAAVRRGRPTFHRRFGEDAAVLAAVALLSHAFYVVGDDDALSAETRLRLSRLLSSTVGVGGLVSGQLSDLRESAAGRDAAGLTRLNHQKTGVLFIAAAVGGAMIADAGPEAEARARAFGERLGLAFQMLDDLHDLTSSTEVLGKDVGQDADRITFVSLWGEAKTRAAAGDSLDAALEALGDRTSPLARYAKDLFAALAHAA